MKLKKTIKKYRVEFPKLSLVDMIVGFLLWVSYAFSFYFFFKIFREFFRFYAASIHNYELLILSKSALNFFNFFLAFIAVLMAQSIVFTYWIEKPNKYRSRFNNRRVSMINDQRVTNWYFVNWFAKVGWMFGIVAVDSYSFNLYPKYKYIIILTAIVLFAQTWSTFRFNFRKKSLKWILFSFISVVSLSFVLSKINLLNYDEINESILQNNSFYKYDIHLPTSKDHKKLDYYFQELNIFVIENKELNHPDLLIGQSKEKIRIEKINESITEFKKNNAYIEGREKVFYLLNVDKNTKMKSVIEVKNELLSLGAEFISYSVKPKEKKFDIPFYIDEKYITSAYPYLKSNVDFDNKIGIELTELNKIRINGVLTTIENLKNQIKETQSDGTKYLFDIKVDKTITFETYIEIINELIAAIDDMKTGFAIDYPKLISEYEYNPSKEITEKLILINKKFNMKIRDDYY